MVHVGSRRGRFLADDVVEIAVRPGKAGHRSASLSGAHVELPQRPFHDVGGDLFDARRPVDHAGRPAAAEVLFLVRGRPADGFGRRQPRLHGGALPDGRLGRLDGRADLGDNLLARREIAAT